MTQDLIARGSLSRLVFGLPLICVCACSSPRLEFSSGVAVENVAVLDVRNGEVAEDMTVVLEHNRIVAVEASDRIILGEAVERIPGGGKYLIPGLWDMHVHSVDPYSSAALPLFLANGVTGIRDMWGDLETAAEIQRQVDVGEKVSPRFVVPGHILDGARPWWEGSVAASSPAEARSMVDSLADAGAAFIKVYSLLERDVFIAVLKRAAELGLPVSGHVPYSVTAQEASELGQASMEHLFGVMEGCSSFESDLMTDRKNWLAARDAGDQDARNPFFDVTVFERLSEGFDVSLCTTLLDHLARNQTWQVPTLTVSRPGAFGYDSTFTADPRLAYMPPGTTDGWNEVAESSSSASDEYLAAEYAYYLRQLEVVRLLRDREVPILAGSDAPDPFVFFGFSLHDELELLVEAGLTEIEALQAATLNAAVFLKATDSLGTIEPGMHADLVLLDGNPLEEISNTRKIVSVMLNGRLFDRTQLDAMLARAEADANNQSNPGT